MPGAMAEIWRDDDHLSSGTHKGGTSTTISDRGKDFKSCGVYPGFAVKNITGGTTGSVSAVSEDTVATNISFHNGDTYKIYKTGSYNSKLATIYVDRRAGRKVIDPSETINGILVEDEDLDEHEKHVWGPGQPWRN